MSAETMDLVAEADQAARRAAADIELLEGQIRHGDETITANQLGKARDVARFAELRVEAAKQRRPKISGSRQPGSG